MFGVCDTARSSVVNSEPLIEWNYDATVDVFNVDVCKGNCVAGVCASTGVFVRDECDEFRRGCCGANCVWERYCEDACAIEAVDHIGTSSNGNDASP